MYHNLVTPLEKRAITDLVDSAVTTAKCKLNLLAEQLAHGVTERAPELVLPVPAELSCPPTLKEAELQTAIHSMHPAKAPGIDGKQPRHVRKLYDILHTVYQTSTAHQLGTPTFPHVWIPALTSILWKPKRRLW